MPPTQGPQSPQEIPDLELIFSQADREELETPESLRAIINNAIKTDNLQLAIQTLERLRDSKSGIKSFVFKDSSSSDIPILVRDARKQQGLVYNGTEAFEMQYLNMIRAAGDVISIEKNQGRINLAKEKILLQELKIKAVAFTKYCGNLDLELTNQESLYKLLQNETMGVADRMEKAGIKDAIKKLDIAKDYQHFKDPQHDIITLSKVTNPETKKQYTVIEAEYSYGSLTEAQKQEYEKIESEDKPKWFAKLSTIEQGLVTQYKSAIIDDRNLIPTQLTRIPGMRNNFKKITAVKESKEPVTIVDISRHAGTLAMLNSKVSEKELQRITNLNTEQANEWIRGKGATSGPKLHANTFNSAPIGNKSDRHIVSRTRNAIKVIGGKYTNDAFNIARRFGKLASDSTGAYQYLAQLNKSLAQDTNLSLELISHLKPRSYLQQALGISKPKGKFEDLLIENKGLSYNLKEVLCQAHTLKNALQEAELLFNFERENVSAKVSVALNNLTQQVAIAKKDPNGAPIGLSDMENSVTLSMCKSGKDRTGIAMFIQSADAVAKTTGIIKPIIDQILINAGHTAQQAGGIYSGGSTIGSMGIRKGSKYGIPLSRQKEMKDLVQITSEGSHIKSTTFKLDQLIAQNPQKSSTQDKKIKPPAMAEASQTLRKQKRQKTTTPNTTPRPTGSSKVPIPRNSRTF